MGIFDKIIKKSNKSMERQGKLSKEKPVVKEEATKDEPTIAQLEERAQVKKEGAKKTAAKAVNTEDTRNAYRVLIRPMVTEKGTYLAGQNKYLFEVSPKANKIEIKKAIKAVYGVEPISVRVISLPSKKVEYRRIKGMTKARKKAIVTLAEGDAIQVYEGV